MSTTTASCPTCGAPIVEGMNRCRYCGCDLYFKGKSGVRTIARDGDMVTVVRQDPVYIPSFSSYEGSDREYEGDGGTFTRPNVGSGYVIFPTESDVDKWNNERRAYDRKMARPLYKRIFWLVLLSTVAYTILFMAVKIF